MSEYPVREYIVRETCYPLTGGKQEVVGELVRCKDCVHLSNDRIAPEWYRRCRIYGCGKADKGFCDNGERSEDAL